MNQKDIRIAVELTLPPTSNHIYTNRGGKRILSNEARSWKRRAVSLISRTAKLGWMAELDVNSRYLLVLVFYFDYLENKGWSESYTRGPKKGKRKAETRWRKIDLSNRIKLAEDAMKEATGVDDSATFAQILLKEEDAKNTRLSMTLVQIPEELWHGNL